MKTSYSAIIVVEGAMDLALLSSFIDADIVTTNGSEVSRETIEFLKEAKKTRDIVVLTDPDAPGKRIRDILDQHIPGLLHAFVPKRLAIKGHKVGIAESSKEAILEALNNVIPASERKQGTISAEDLYALGLVGQPNSSLLRERLAEKLHLGHCNGKTLLKRLNALGLSKEEVAAAL